MATKKQKQGTSGSAKQSTQTNGGNHGKLKGRRGTKMQQLLGPLGNMLTSEHTQDDPALRGNHPTMALPGTPEKVKVLEYRISMGFPLWHPLDAKW